MSGTTHVNGLADLQRMLDQLPAQMERNVMRGAMRAGGKVFLAGAKERVPVQSGELRDSLRLSVSARGGTVRASIRTNDFKAHWAEFGTAAHLIRVSDEIRPQRLTRHGMRQYSMRTINKMIQRGSLVIGGQYVGQAVSHPGAMSHPYMRPTLDNDSPQAVEAVGEYVKKRLATKNGLDTSHIDIEAEAP